MLIVASVALALQHAVEAIPTPTASVPQPVGATRQDPAQQSGDARVLLPINDHDAANAAPDSAQCDMTSGVPTEVLAAMKTEELLYLESKPCPNDNTPCPYTAAAADAACDSAPRPAE